MMVGVTCSASWVLSNSLSLKSSSVILTSPGQGETSLPQEGKRQREKLLFGPQATKANRALFLLEDGHGCFLLTQSTYAHPCRPS